MLKKVKRRLYKEGRYLCQLPKCDTTKWSVDDWCNWIDTELGGNVFIFAANHLFEVRYGIS